MNAQPPVAAGEPVPPLAARAAVAVISFCLTYAKSVIVAGALLTILCGWYAATHFRLNSDIDALLPSNVEWRQNELSFENAFHRFNVLEAVIEGPTPELAALAASELTTALSEKKGDFQTVFNAGASDFIRAHAFFFLPPDALKQAMDGLVQGEPIIHDIATDRSLRGLVAGLEDSLLGIQQKRLTVDDFAKPLNPFSDTLDNVLAKKPASFSWRQLTSGKPASANDLRGFVEIRPTLDFKSLEPGLEAENNVRATAAPILAKHQSSLKLTGLLAINDAQFGTIQENAVRNGVITVLLVLFILWLALRSPRLILALVINIIVGLALTAAAGALMLGAFNVISIYFAVLFVGIGVDFAIQFSVRYREERYRLGDLREALRSAGARVGMPLALASLATAAGFFSFLPTDYRGVSELGLIAGVGMLIAFVTSVTLLPALIALLNPPGEPSELGYTSLAPVDNTLAKHRIPIIVGTLGIVALASPLMLRLGFDNNPIDLQDPHAEAVAAYLDLRKDPTTGVDAIEMLKPSLKAADQLAAEVGKSPDVATVRTLSTFIPADQDAKTPLIRAAGEKLADSFKASETQPAPSDPENVDALKEGASRLTEAAGDAKGPGADAMRRLAGDMTKLAEGPADLRAAAADALIVPLNADLQDLQRSLTSDPITEKDLPRELVEDWIAQDGRARVSILPNGDPEDPKAMQAFAQAMQAIDPKATEGPIASLEAGKMVTHAFIQAGFWAVVSITVLLLLFLRKIGDVILTLFPLGLAGIVTMELMSAFGMQFNFANIIALPLLLGVGVAFKIYYIVAWREGTTHLLQTPLTRAVFYSALTTATAFGSLWLSSHPGTSSMGKLLALSLVCTLAAAVLFQPILMGKPRAPSPNA